MHRVYRSYGFVWKEVFQTAFANIVVKSLGKIFVTMPMFLCLALWSADLSSTRLDRGWVCMAVHARRWRFELDGNAFKIAGGGFWYDLKKVLASRLLRFSVETWHLINRVSLSAKCVVSLLRKLPQPSCLWRRKQRDVHWRCPPPPCRTVGVFVLGGDWDGNETVHRSTAHWRLQQEESPLVLPSRCKSPIEASKNLRLVSTRKRRPALLCCQAVAPKTFWRFGL